MTRIPTSAEKRNQCMLCTKETSPLADKQGITFGTTDEHVAVTVEFFLCADDEDQPESVILEALIDRLTALRNTLMVDTE